MMARKPSTSLSERHINILKVLDTFQKENGYPPSIREICDKTGITSTSVVNYYLMHLRKLGWIERDEKVSRGIRLLKPVSSLSGAVRSGTAAVQRSVQNVRSSMEELLQIPIAGRIVASAPVPVPPSDFNYFDPESMVSVASSLLPAWDRNNQADLFALEVQGDSMIDAMINDGDIVIMKKAYEARNGEMVAVWLTDRDETTLKYFYKENNRVRLQPANPTMQPIYIEDPSTVQIKGKVVMVIRQVGGMVQ